MVKSTSTVNNRLGYTLIETLIVISILIVFIMISMSSYQHEEHINPPDDFLEQLGKDVLYFQHRATTYQTPITITFNPSEDHYIIKDSTHVPSTIKRSYHSDLQVYLSTLKKPIQYNIDGTIINPGEILLYYHDDIYRVTFPFGKGRFYVTKES